MRFFAFGLRRFGEGGEEGGGRFERAWWNLIVLLIVCGRGEEAAEGVDGELGVGVAVEEGGDDGHRGAVVVGEDGEDLLKDFDEAAAGAYGGACHSVGR